jgi:hypothetical protein
VTEYGMRFGMWNIRSLFRAGSIMTVLRELSRYKLDLVGVQVNNTKPSGEYTLLYGRGIENHDLGTVIL